VDFKSQLQMGPQKGRHDERVSVKKIRRR